MKCEESFVYCWTDHKRNMLYIGYHKGRLNDGYVCSSKIMMEQYRKRSEDFTRTIIAMGSREDMMKLETRILTSIDAKNDKNCYNQHNGNGYYHLKGRTKEHNRKISESTKGKKKSEEARERMSAAKKGKPTNRITSNETKEKIANTLRGRKHSSVSIEKMKLSHAGFKHTDEAKKKIGLTSTGRRHTEESKRKIGASKKGVERSDETKAKISNANTGYKHTDEAKKKMRESNKNRPIMTCPHCGKYGKTNVMHRYHFDNCKHKMEK